MAKIVSIVPPAVAGQAAVVRLQAHYALLYSFLQHRHSRQTAHRRLYCTEPQAGQLHKRLFMLALHSVEQRVRTNTVYCWYQES